MNKGFVLTFLMACGTQEKDSSINIYDCQWQCKNSCNRMFSGYKDHPAHENPFVLEACLGTCNSAPDGDQHTFQCTSYISDTIQYYKQENQ